MTLVRVTLVIAVSICLTLPRGALCTPGAAGERLTGPVDISAKELEYNRAENVYMATGNVDLRQGARRLTADYVEYHQDTGDLLARGHVVFREEQDVVECARLEVNLITKRGSIEKGKVFLKTGNFHIVGDKIAKVGEAEYSMAKGEFTTCEGTRPAWKFSARDLDLTVEGYATARGAKFSILNQPVFYFPWGIFPVKTERQSGLLMPDLVTSSRDGLKLRESFFWAISKDKDATLGLQYIEQRGWKPDVEFRYALREDLKGQWYSTIIQDKDEGDMTRWELKGQHEQKLGRDYTLKTKVDQVSDFNYVKDFGTTVAERSENVLKSTAYIEKPMPLGLLTAETAYFRDLTHRDNDPTFKYYPHATYFTEDLPILKDRFYFDLSGDLNNFYREKGSSYTRFAVEPRLRLPYSWNGVNFLFSGKAYETLYYVDGSDQEDRDTKGRLTYQLEGNSNIQLVRDYFTSLFNLGQVQSVIKPQLNYIFVPTSGYRDTPFIDPYDRINNVNAITYSLNHYLNTITRDAGTREVSLLEIEQTYGLSGDLTPSVAYKGSGNRFSNITERLTIFPREHLSLVNQTEWNAYGDGLVTIRNSVSHEIPNTYNVTVYHSYTKDLTNEMYLRLGGTYRRVEFTYQVVYDFLEKTSLDTSYQVVYRAGCWAMTLTLVQSTRPNDTTVRLGIDLAGITGK
jgi:LPS-assembly protein